MSGFTIHLKQRIEETRKELETAKKRTIEARAHEETLASDLVGYEKVLSAELRRNGGQIQRADEFPKNEEQKELTLAGGQTDKTKFAKEVILKAGAAGASAGEIITAFEKAGIKVKVTYVYSILHRLKEGKKLGYRNGRYYLNKETASE